MTSLPLRDLKDVEQGEHYEIDPKTGCWNWLLDTYKGYGWHRSRGAHRWMWEREVGPIPKGTHLHHVCRNTLCCNPAHLRPVAPSDHQKEHSRERSPLTLEQVTEIRVRVAAGELPTDLAAEYPVSRHAIQRLVQGKAWKDVPGPLEKPARICPECGGEVHTRRGAIYCSIACRARSNSRNQWQRSVAARRAA